MASKVAPLRTMVRYSIRQVSHMYTLIAIFITPVLLYILFQANPLTVPTKYNTNTLTLQPQQQHYQEPYQQLGLLQYQQQYQQHRQPMGCILPKLHVNDSDIMQFYKKEETVSCGADAFDWVSVRRGKFAITPEAKQRYGSGSDDIRCKLTPLVKRTDYETVELKEEVLRDVKEGTDLNHDFYKVECSAQGGHAYRNYHAGVHSKPNVVKRQRTTEKPGGGDVTGLDIDVIIIGQDSLSRMAWMRHLPLTRKYLVEDLKAIEMEGETVLGDGTPATIIPLLTGHREEELHEARRGYTGARHVDDFPWIWNDFRDKGYATLWQEDESTTGTFHYRLIGFEGHPVDHFYRPFSLYTDKRKSESPEHCLGAKPRFVAQNDYVTDLFDVYGQGRRKWAMTFKSENSHNDNNHASKLDEHMRAHLQELHRKGHLDNALLIVMADHGARFSNIRAFAQGKLEERMPYLAIRVPDKFHTKYPDIVQNLKSNSQRLTTPFDLHETLHEVLRYTGSGPANISKRGVSLFKKIPIERDCKNADVDPHWCYCLDWSPLQRDSHVAMDAAKHVVQVINHVTEPYRDGCALLEIASIQSAFEMKVKDGVLKFKDTGDGGRGRFGQMTDVTKQSKIMYQVTLQTTPGNGQYEATLSYDVRTKEFSASLKSISRINKYGMAPWCIMTSVPQMRPYCTCKQPPPTGNGEAGHH